jgi:hypothetical protein
MEDFDSFACLIEAIRPWLSHLVIVGGWAHRLHRLHPLATSLKYQPIRTRDADIAFSDNAPLDGDLRTALRNANFKERLSREHTPAVTQYRLGDEDDGFYAEFLTPLRGDGLRRDGQDDVTMAKAGITAQKLRHLDLLLLAPWSVEVGPAIGIPVASKVDLLVPNPVTFIVQKLLIHKRRKPPEKKPQDVLYIHDTLELFGASLDHLRTIWADQVCPEMPVRTAMTAMNVAKQLFDKVTDTTREAARIPQDRRPSAERLRAASEYGLGEIFGNG